MFIDKQVTLRDPRDILASANRTLKFDGAIHKIAFSKDGLHLGCSGGSALKGFIKLYDAETYQEIVQLDVLGCVRAIEFTPNGDRFVHGGGDHMLTIRLVDDFSIVQQFEHGAAVYTCAFSPDSSLLAIGGASPKVVVRDVLSGAIVKSYDTKDPYGNNSGSIFSCDFKFSGSKNEEVTPPHLLLMSTDSHGCTKVRNMTPI